MAVAFQAAAVAKTSNNTTQSHAPDITGGATANRCCLVAVYRAVSAGTTLGAEINNVAMTSLGSFSEISGYTADMFYLASDSTISTGSNDIKTTTSNTGVRYVIAAIFNGVDQSTPVSGYDSDSAYNSSPFAAAPSNSAGNLLADLVFVYGGNAGSGGSVVLTPTAPASSASSGDIDATNEYQVLTSTSTGSPTSIGTAADLAVAVTQMAVSLIAASGAGATAVTLSGPASGAVNVASTNFTIGVNGTPITGTLVVTPATSVSGGGSFSPTTVSLTTASPSATVTFTPTKSGSHTITCSDDGGLTDPTPLTYSVRPEVTLTLVTSPSDSTPRASLSNLKWAWFDAVTPDVLVAPTDKGTTETTNGSGVITIPLANSTKTNGQVGWLVLSDSDGTTTQAPPAKMFSGPAAVT